MAIATELPHPRLRAFVSEYRLRHEAVESVRRLVFPSRNSQFLEFYLGEQPKVMVQPGAAPSRVPDSVVVGNQALGRVELFLSGSLRTFTIMFRPTGFHQLFGVPMEGLAGKGESAEAVLGSMLQGLREQLGNASTLAEMCTAADSALLMTAAKCRPEVQTACAHIERSLRMGSGKIGFLTVDQLAELSGFSVRQFERKFKAAIGVSPKRYLRVDRLHRAIDLKTANPSLTWGVIAAETGFHDQMHLVHDFKELGGDSPGRLFGEIIGGGPR